MNIAPDPDTDITKCPCPNCCSPNVAEVLVLSTFQYGVTEPVMLTLIAPEPVRTCADCKESFTDYRAEEIREATVERYRRMFAPRKP